MSKLQMWTWIFTGLSVLVTSYNIGFLVGTSMCR